jgi:cadmium resistance protein CadD (predicted permease)
MQLTRFDRWLREKFVYETQINTLSAVDSLPSGIRTVKKPNLAGRRYNYLYVAKSSKAADHFLSQLKDNNQMYTTQVVDKNAWYVPFFAPKNKSVTWWIISTVIILIALFCLLFYLNLLRNDPVFMKNFMETLELFKKI